MGLFLFGLYWRFFLSELIEVCGEITHVVELKTTVNELETVSDCIAM